MISFEIENCPNGQNVSNDQLEAIYAIMTSDPLYYDYVITEPPVPPFFLIVEKRCPKYQYSVTFFRVEISGDWGVLYEAKRDAPPVGDTPL